MWQTDTVNIQTKVETNVLGSISVVWSDNEDVLVDVQDINKELVFKEYGLTDAGEFKQVFDLTNNTGWVKGNQVKFDNTQWWVKLVNDNMEKIGQSNHIFIILSQVI